MSRREEIGSGEVGASGWIAQEACAVSPLAEDDVIIHNRKGTVGY